MRLVSVFFSVIVFVSLSPVIVKAGRVVDEDKLHHGQLLKLRLDIENPCKHIPNELAPEWTQTCNDHFSHRIVPILKTLQTACFVQHNYKPRRLNKRSLVELGIEVVDFIGTAVTNFVTKQFRSHSEQARQETHSRLKNSASTEVAEVLSRGPDEVIPISKENNVFRRLQFVEKKLPVVVYAINEIESEMLVAKYNLLKVAKKCIRGEVATYELADLMNYPGLASIKAEDTILVGLSVDADEHEIEFTFHVREVEQNADWTQSNAIKITISSTTILNTIAIVLMIIKICCGSPMTGRRRVIRDIPI